MQEFSMLSKSVLHANGVFIAHAIHLHPVGISCASSTASTTLLGKLSSPRGNNPRTIICE